MRNVGSLRVRSGVPNDRRSVWKCYRTSITTPYPKRRLWARFSRCNFVIDRRLYQSNAALALAAASIRTLGEDNSYSRPNQSKAAQDSTPYSAFVLIRMRRDAFLLGCVAEILVGDLRHEMLAPFLCDQLQKFMAKVLICGFC